MNPYSYFRLLKYNYTIFTIAVVDLGSAATNQMLEKPEIEKYSYEQKAGEQNNSRNGVSTGIGWGVAKCFAGEAPICCFMLSVEAGRRKVVSFGFGKKSLDIPKNLELF